jgi:hypothetical protein
MVSSGYHVEGILQKVGLHVATLANQDPVANKLVS